MTVKESKRAAVVAAQRNRTIRVTQKAYDLAVNLFDNDADKGETPVTKDMTGPALSELTSKGVAKRIGLTKGRYGKLGSVKLLVRPDSLLTVANRSSQKRESASQATPVLTIDELEEFIATYHRAQEPLIEVAIASDHVAHLRITAISGRVNWRRFSKYHGWQTPLYGNLMRSSTR